MCTTAAVAAVGTAVAAVGTAAPTVIGTAVMAAAGTTALVAIDTDGTFTPAAASGHLLVCLLHLHRRWHGGLRIFIKWGVHGRRQRTHHPTPIIVVVL